MAYTCRDRYIDESKKETKMTNTFRKEYRPLSDEQKQLVNSVKDTAELLMRVFDLCPQNRELALARTKLEESVMWCVKAIT